LQGTAELPFKRSSPEKTALTNASIGRKMEEGRHQQHTVYGLLMHTSLAITSDGMLLALTDTKV